MADVTALCPRVILIHNGSLIFDGELASLARDLSPFKLLRLTLLEERPIEGLAPASGAGGYRTVGLGFPSGSRAQRLRLSQPACCKPCRWSDLTVEDPPIEAVIDRIYSGGVTMNPRGGLALIRGLWLSWMQYRSFFFVLAFRLDDPAAHLPDGLVYGSRVRAVWVVTHAVVL